MLSLQTNRISDEILTLLPLPYRYEIFAGPTFTVVETYHNYGAHTHLSLGPQELVGVAFGLCWCVASINRLCNRLRDTESGSRW
jgi:hypothetical protein